MKLRSGTTLEGISTPNETMLKEFMCGEKGKGFLQRTVMVIKSKDDFMTLLERLKIFTCNFIAV